METRGAFPGWLNRLWWVLTPGVLLVAVSMLGLTGYLLSGAAGSKATGLAAVGGVGGYLMVSWLLVSLALMHVWVFVAAGFVLLKNEYLTVREEWKVAGTVLMFLGVYSPVIAVFVANLF